MQCSEGKSKWEKQHTVLNVCQNRRPYRTQTLFQFSATPPPVLGTTENATFAHFMKKSMHLKTGFVLDYQVLFLLLIGLQIEKSLQFNRSISIDLWRQKVATGWFLPFTSKTGQSVAQNRQQIFSWVLLVNRGHSLAFYRSSFRLQLKGYSR